MKYPYNKTSLVVHSAGLSTINLLSMEILIRLVVKVYFSKYGHKREIVLKLLHLKWLKVKVKVKVKKRNRMI